MISCQVSSKLKWLKPCWTVTIALFIFTLLSTTAARASLYSDFLTVSEPPHLSLTIFTSGYGSDSYDMTQEGFEFEQSLTRFVGLVGRVSAYQSYRGDGYNSPFPFSDTDVFARGNPRNFGLFEGGLDLTPIEGTSVKIMGGRAVGDSNTPLIDGELSTWILFHSLHPINFSSTVTTYQEAETRNFSTMDLRTVAYSNGRLMLLAGAGGAIWGGGGSDLQGQAGPDIGVFVNTWDAEIDVQIGYGGNPHTYGLVTVSKQFGWDE